MKDMDAAVILKAQTRILRLKSRMTWREVADVLAVRADIHELNVSIPFNFVVYNKIPGVRDLRWALGLPKFLPSERKSRRSEPKGLISFPVFRKVAREDVLEKLEALNEKKDVGVVVDGVPDDGLS